MSAPALDGLLIGGVLCLLGAGLLVAGLGKLRTGLSLYRTDTTPLREIPRADGPVEFDGTVVGLGLLGLGVRALRLAVGG